MSFASDNWAGAAPEILQAVIDANTETVPSYGGDALTKKTEQKFSDIFERDCSVFFVATGGGANGLALSVITPPYGMVLCHNESHIQMDECAGPEFFTGGAKLLPIPGEGGKITPQSLEKTIAGFPDRAPHGAPITTLSLTQGTESGTIYSVSELKALNDVAKKAGLQIHMDGARFANAVVGTGATPADLTWKSGVDVLCFGGTKNGCLAAEAVVFFDKQKAADFSFRRKRAGHLISKMRFIAAQFDAYLSGDLWLRLARHANEKAQALSDGLSALPGIEIAYPTQINEVFARIPNPIADDLRQDGIFFYPWITPGNPPEKDVQRLICSFRTTDDEIETFLQQVRKKLR